MVGFTSLPLLFVCFLVASLVYFCTRLFVRELELTIIPRFSFWHLSILLDVIVPSCIRDFGLNTRPLYDVTATSATITAKAGKQTFLNHPSRTFLLSCPSQVQGLTDIPLTRR
jgi:hypothetical protein